MMKRLLVLVFMGIAVLSGAVFGQVGLLQEVPCSIQPGSQSWEIILSSTPLEELVAVPRDADELRYGALRLGNGPDRTVSLAVFEGTEGLCLWLDANNNEDLTDDIGGGRGKQIGWESSAWRFSIDVDYVENGQTVTVPYTVVLMAYPVDDETTPYQYVAFYAGHRQGLIEIAGKILPIAIIDFNGNGRFDDVEDIDRESLLVALDTDGDGEISYSPHEIFLPGETLRVGEHGYKIASISPSGRRIELAEIEQRFPTWPIYSLGHTFPEVDGETLGGEHFRLSDLRGKVVALFFVPLRSCQCDGPFDCFRSDSIARRCMHMRSIAAEFGRDPRVQVVVILTGEGTPLDEWNDPDLGWKVVSTPSIPGVDHPLFLRTFILDQEGIIRDMDRPVFVGKDIWGCPNAEMAYVFDVEWVIERLLDNP